MELSPGMGESTVAWVLYLRVLWFQIFTCWPGKNSMLLTLLLFKLLALSLLNLALICSI